MFHTFGRKTGIHLPFQFIIYIQMSIIIEQIASLS